MGEMQSLQSRTVRGGTDALLMTSPHARQWCFRTNVVNLREQVKHFCRWESETQSFGDFRSRSRMSMPPLFSRRARSTCCQRRGAVEGRWF
ncbi:unnamed protein product [Aphanomyces euteiches]